LFIFSDRKLASKTNFRLWF